MTIRDHRNAILAALQADLPGSVFHSYSVGADETEPRPERYAVLFVAKSSMTRSRYSSRQNRDVYTVTIHSVGADEDSALWVQERVDKLTNHVLPVPERRLWPVEYVTGRPPALDDDGPVPLWFSISQFDIVSDPA